jgi:plastocyanin
MKRIVAFGTVLAVFVALAALGRAGDDAKAKKGKQHTVRMEDNKFKPATLKIKVGDSVVWVNKGKKTHTATSDDDGKTFDTKDVAPGKKSKPVTFAKAGKFKYVCTFHEKMKGTVIVQGAKKE